MSGVAVIIPAYNAGRFLGNALRSLKEQTQPPTETIVVDDGSTDDTPQIAESMGVGCLRQDRRGPGAARNRGLSATTAPLVAFLDADDEFMVDKLEKQTALLRSAAAPACCSDAVVVSDEVVGATKNRGRDVPAELTFDVLMAGNPVICSTVLARREAVLEAGGFDEDPTLVSTEDYDLWLRLARQGPLVYQDQPLARYRIHSQSLSDNLRFLSGIDRIMEKVITSFPQDARLEVAARLRRSRVRLDAAYDLAGSGEGRRARELLREARRLGGWSWKAVKIHLRSLVGSGRNLIAGSRTSGPYSRNSEPR